MPVAAEPGWVQTLSALLTPVIGVITVFIAYQQLQMNRYRWRFDLYEKRLAVYGEVVKMLSSIMSKANVDITELVEFRRQVSEADFIFGSEIQAYIEEIYQRGVKLHHAAEEYRDGVENTPPNYNHEDVVRRKWEHLEWLTKQFPVARTMFKKYLDVGHLD